MINLLIAIALAIAAWLPLILLGWPWYTGLVPALLVFPVALFLLSQRTARQVQDAMAPIGALAQQLQQAGTPEAVRAKVDEIRQRMIDVRDRYARWQVFLGRQIDAQIGLLDYNLGKFDEALPLLERGFRDWTSKVAAACVHYRRDRLAQAWAAFEEAAGYAPKEATVYVIWGTLKERKGLREEALAVFTRGLEQVPDHAVLRQLKNTVANKQRIDTEKLGETWQRLFPEELAQQMMVRGRRGPPVLPPGVTPRTLQGPPPPRPRGKLARRR
jgi:tetratricopeptide (TPR) repeat protein